VSDQTITRKDNGDRVITARGKLRSCRRRAGRFSEIELRRWSDGSIDLIEYDHDTDTTLNLIELSGSQVSALVRFVAATRDT